MNGVLSAEWLKIRSVRSTYFLLVPVALMVFVGAGLSAVVAVAWDHAPSLTARGHVSMVSMAQLAGWVAELAMGVFGALAITGEYRSGTIRASLAAVPRRWRLLVAKTALVGGFSLLVAEAAIFLTYLAQRAIVGDRPVILDAVSLRHDAPLMIVEGLLATVFALVGLGLGAVLRSAAGAILGLVLLWYVVPIATNMLPQPWHTRLGSLVPDALPGQVIGTGNDHSVYGAALPPWAAALAMLAYAVLPLAAATVLLCRRDTR